MNEVTTKPKHKISELIKNNKNLIYCLGAVVAIVVIAVIAWAVTPLLNRPELGENFFVSDETKTTISLTPSESSTSAVHETHIVYEYDDDNNVISMKTYFEYPDAETAEIAYESLKNQPEFKGAELKDNFIIVTADESQFKGLTASDIRQQADAIRAFQLKTQPQTEENTEEPEVIEAPEETWVEATEAPEE